MTWAEIRERLKDGEPVTIAEITEAIAAAPPPADLQHTELRSKRRPGRPAKWTRDDVEIVENICHQVHFWSWYRRSPLTWQEVYDRVGATLSLPMTGKAVENLIARHIKKKKRPGVYLRRFTARDYSRVLKPRA
jgi:hypothetical protein